MAELIKATNITRVRIEDEVGEGTRVRAMMRTYVHPGLYILSRHPHGSSPEGRLFALIIEGRGGWAIWVNNSDSVEPSELTGYGNSLAEAVQVALLELHK